MRRRTLEELNLIDGFLFGMALDHEKYGRIIAKTILDTVLQRQVRVGKINTEKVILPNRPEYHGIRMDAFIQEDAVDISRGDVFDIEPENKQREKDFLPRRMRYYHSRIDSKILQAGRSYAYLPDSWVIFFTSFDPFGAGRMVYTVRRKCVELPDLKIDDGAVTVFLYVDGMFFASPFCKKLQSISAESCDCILQKNAALHCRPGVTSHSCRPDCIWAGLSCQ